MIAFFEDKRVAANDLATKVAWASAGNILTYLTWNNSAVLSVID